MGLTYTMAEMKLLVKPGPFITNKLGDPEQLYQDFTKYVVTFEEFLIATGADGTHMDNHGNGGGCKKAKAMLRLVGRESMKSLFDLLVELLRQILLTKPSQKFQMVSDSRQIMQQQEFTCSSKCHKEVVALQSGMLKEVHNSFKK